MSPPNRGLIGLGVGLGVAGAAAAAGIVAERMSRQRGDALETGVSLVIEPSLELVAVADDGVPLHVEVDEPEPGAAAALAARLAEREPGAPGIPTVVLSHGYCLSSRCWVFQRRALVAAGYRVVTWDQRGHGLSEKGGKESYTIAQLGEDLFQVLAVTAPKGPLLLGGHSMGGMTTMALGSSHPDLVRERVLGLACISTSPGGMPLASGNLAASTGRVLLGGLGPQVAGLMEGRPELLRLIIDNNAELEDFLVERYSFASPVPRSVVRLTASMILGTDLGVISSFTPAFEDYDQRAGLVPYRGVQSLVFNGQHDLLTPPEHSELIVEALPGAQHVIVRDAGHVIMLEHPELLNEQLLSLAERSMLSVARDVDAADQPRVRRVVTDVGKRRRIEEAKRSPKRVKGAKAATGTKGPKPAKGKAS